MAFAQSDLLQGTLDLLILKALALEQMHGMGISRRIGQVTNGAFKVLVSRSAPDGASGLANVVLGAIGNQSARQVL
jgi:hypothetical protein